MPLQFEQIPPALQSLYAYWASKRKGDAIPSRADISPIEIPNLLPFIYLLEDVDGQFRYRLAGAAIVEAYGFNPTGKSLDQVLKGKNLAFATRACRDALASGRVVLSKSAVTDRYGEPCIVTRIAMPLRARGTRSMLLAGFFMEPDSIDSSVKHTEPLGRAPFESAML